MILAISDLQVVPILPIKFQVNWHFDSREEAQLDFQDGGTQRPSWISNWNIFTAFSSSSCPDTFYQVLSVQEKKRKREFPRWRPSWISHLNDFSYFFFFFI